MRNIMKEAHSLTKKIIRKGDCYRATFRVCLSFVHFQVKKGVSKVVELKGTEKQVKWANDIRSQVIETIEIVRKKQVERVSILSDKVKKDGTVITAKDRVAKMNKRFDTLLSDIKGNDSSIFFIDNFSDITSKTCTPDLSKKFAVNSGLEKIGNEMAKYFKGKGC